DVSRPGIKSLIESLKARGERTPENVVDSCLDLMGPLEVQPESRVELIDFVGTGGEFGWDTSDQLEASKARVSELLQLIVSLREYQYA
ncbi:MAG: hypothetical protein J4N90_02335, partial [Chloroflexi bacterium]|nr:hypothetical protein [Chloroflexota bacterium]